MSDVAAPSVNTEQEDALPTTERSERAEAADSARDRSPTPSPDRSVSADEQTIREALDRMGGHSHWRVGGSGGRCDSCERNKELRDAALAALGRLAARLAAAEQDASVAQPAPDAEVRGRSCGKPTRGVYGVESNCARPEGHFGSCDSVLNHRDWPNHKAGPLNEPGQPEQAFYADAEGRFPEAESAGLSAPPPGAVRGGKQR